MNRLFALLVAVLLVAGSAYGQLKTKVNVDLSQTKAMLYTTSVGIAADRWDLNSYNSETAQMLMDAGITNLRFPGNEGIDALYHWSTGKITNPYTNDRAPAFPQEKQFPAVVPLIDTLGTALVSVNYGSNLDGSGGGEPLEAAAWVAYANGDPANTQAIGKDSKGNDWKTIGYWANLRASSPLATDDGYNFLRIGHVRPMGVLLWTIGNDPALNGFYGQSRTIGSDADSSGKYGESQSPEPDLHAGTVDTSKDWGKHQGNAKVSPTAYGQGVVEYAKAMKAVDPHIMIGAFVMVPPYSQDANPFGKNWNADVLKAACGSMDFSAVSFWEGKTLPPNWEITDERDLLTEARDQMDVNKYYPQQNAIQHDFALLGHDLIDKYKKFCPKGHAPQLAITNVGFGQWQMQNNPAVHALFAVDTFAWLLQTGAYTVIWSPIHGESPTFLDNKNQPAPAYYGIKLFHEAAGPGDTFVGTTSQMDTLTSYALKRRDGGLSVLLINKDPQRSTTVTVTVDGYNFATKGTRYEYGKVVMDAKKEMTETPIDNLGSTFTVEVPRYSAVAVVIPKAQ
jgi:alpha-L-arabinofuranosidase